MQNDAPPKEALNVVLAFYRQALLEKQPMNAFSRFVSHDFVEHKPDVELGTRDSAARYLEELINTLPTATWEIVRIVGDASLVAVHARFTPEPDAAPYAVADFFRVTGGLIVEHWDIVAGPTSASHNPHSRF